MNTLFSPLQEFWKKGDKLLLLLCLLASAYGVALIYSATRYNENDREVIIQIIAILLGVVVYILCTFVDFQLFVEKNWKWLFVGSVLFILLLLTPFGSNVGGNRNWLDLPFLPINIQPNEIDKIPFILLLALLITKIQDQGRDIGSVLSVLQIGAYTAFMLGLIAAVCGDMGMCVVYTFIFVTMAWSAGVKLRWFVLAIGAVVIGFAVLWIFVLPNTAAWDSVYFIKRIRVLFDHSFEPLGVGLQQTRSLGDQHHHAGRRQDAREQEGQPQPRSRRFHAEHRQQHPQRQIQRDGGAPQPQQISDRQAKGAIFKQIYVIFKTHKIRAHPGEKALVKGDRQGEQIPRPQRDQGGQGRQPAPDVSSLHGRPLIRPGTGASWTKGSR